MRTPLCDFVGIEFPILAFTHCRDVAAAVSRAGGLGVLGIGVLAVFASLRELLEALGLDPGSGLLITGSVLGVLVAYVLRFTAPAFQAVDASFSHVTPAVTASAQALGAGPVRLLARVHLPQVRAGVAVGFMVVLVDAIKELPMVLLLRPFGFNTVSVWVYQLAKENFWERAALPALVIVVLAVIPVAVLNRQARLARPTGEQQVVGA